VRTRSESRIHKGRDFDVLYLNVEFLVKKSYKFHEEFEDGDDSCLEGLMKEIFYVEFAQKLQCVVAHVFSKNEKKH